MINFLLSLIPVSLVIFCINILFSEGHILEKAGAWMEENLPDYLYKPTVGCVICQSSIWGLIGFFALDYFFDIHHKIELLIPFIFCLCGLNTIISKLISNNRTLQDIDEEAYLKILNIIDAQKTSQSKKAKAES